MEPDKNIRSVEEHRKDLLREAEQYRLVQLARSGRPPEDRIWTRLLNWLERRIIDLGCLLKSHFGGMARSSAETANQHPCNEIV